MTQLLVAHVKLKMILKLIQKFNHCVNNLWYRDFWYIGFHHKNHGLERSAHDYHWYDNINYAPLLRVKQYRTPNPGNEYVVEVMCEITVFVWY